MGAAAEPAQRKKVGFVEARKLGDGRAPRCSTSRRGGARDRPGSQPGRDERSWQRPPSLLASSVVTTAPPIWGSLSRWPCGPCASLGGQIVFWPGAPFFEPHLLHVFDDLV